MRSLEGPLTGLNSFSIKKKECLTAEKAGQEETSAEGLVGAY
jgi:hypothetical protein